MTRKEVIKRLNYLNNKCDPYEWPDTECHKCDEAVDMAIEALEQEPCDDCISRKEIIRWVKTECNPYGKPTLDFESGKKVIEHLEQMPSAEVGTQMSLADCISRQVAIEAIEKYNFFFPEYMERFVTELRDAMKKDLLNEVKSLLPADRPKGHWIENDNGTFSCSNCQSWIPEEQHHYARYCLYCGARMENDGE